MNTKHLINATRKMAEACAEVLEYVQPSLIEGLAIDGLAVEQPKRKPGRPPKVVAAAAPAKKPGAAKVAPAVPAKKAAPPKKVAPGPKAKGPKKAAPAPKAKAKAGSSPSVDSVLEILADGPKPKEEVLNAFGDANRRTTGVVISHAVRQGKAAVAADGLVSLTS